MGRADDLYKRLAAAVGRDGPPSSDYDLNSDVVLPPGRKLREAAVLVACVPGEDGDRVILTQRSPRLKHHPGQIAFAGGKRDESDESIEDAALREAQEEIGLMPQGVQLVGRLPAHETVTGFQVTPVLACVSGAFRPIPEAGEVAEVFSVPLSHVLEPANYRVESRDWQGRRRFYFTVPFGPYYIWGATARILRGLADRMV